jgi:hypothetical protein
MEFVLVLVSVTAVGCMPQPMAKKQSDAPATPATPAPVEVTVADGSVTAPATETVEAKAGVAKQGRSLDNESGIVVEPVKQLFAFKEKSVFDFQIKPALDLYKATNGKGPQTHEEFMEQIIKANNLQLPELPAGQRYVYDPATEMLMVERPAQ